MVLAATVRLICYSKRLTFGTYRSHSPHLYMYARSNELDEVGVISLSDSSVKVEHTAEMDALFDVSA